MDQKSRRLFIALPVDDSSVIESLQGVYRSLGRYSEALKTTDPSNLHITLKFLGSVDEDKSKSIISSFHSLAGDDKIRYIIKGTGCFPSIAAPSVVWAGIDCDMKKITAVFNRVDSFCESFGFEREMRKFIPHLTIARVKRNKDAPEGLKTFIKENGNRVFAETVFDRLVLFESRLNREGPEYMNVAEVKFV